MNPLNRKSIGNESKNHPWQCNDCDREHICTALGGNCFRDKLESAASIGDVADSSSLEKWFPPDFDSETEESLFLD